MDNLMPHKRSRELTEKEFSDYAAGMSVKEVAVGKDISPGTIRKKLKEAGVIRTKEEAVDLARARSPNPENQSNLTQRENGYSYDAKLSQDWLKRGL